MTNPYYEVIDPYYSIRLLTFDFNNLIIKSKKVNINTTSQLFFQKNSEFGTLFISMAGGIPTPIYHSCCYLHAFMNAKKRRVTNRFTILLYGYENAFEDDIEKITPFRIIEIND